MSKQLYEDLLSSFKKSNKDRKLKLANKAGYNTIEEYQEYLSKQITSFVVKDVFKEKISTKKLTIHIVDIIDCSGSMDGLKIKAAVEGINKGIIKLKQDKVANYTYTLCDFSYHNDINFSIIKSNISKVEPISFIARGQTALYDAIAKTLHLLKSDLKKDEKVLVNIYTDGGENGSKSYSAQNVSDLIKSLEGIFTVTFIGTEFDTKTVIRNLNIDESNTLVYDGSAKGLEETMNMTLSARSNYSQSVSEGKDVTKGFYKNIIKK